MIKIAHIAKPVGGVGVYLDLLTHHLSENKFQHVILYNVDEVEVTNSKFKQQIHIPIIREVQFFKDLKCLIKIIKQLKLTKPDRIHCHSAKAGILGRIAGAYLKIPTYYTPHAYSYLSAESKFKKYVFKGIEKIFRFFPAKTIACSKSEYDRTINQLNFKKKNVFHWNNSIEDNLKREPSQILEKLPKHFICSIGRPSYQKNTELMVKSIIEAKKKVENIHLVIVGVGYHSPTIKKVESLIKENNLKENVTLINWIDRQETITILENSLFYISTSRYEGLSYAAIEALALAKPFIATNVDGNKDLVINEYNGFLVDAESEFLAEKIIELHSNQNLRREMGQNSRALFQENFNINKNIEKLEQIYFE